MQTLSCRTLFTCLFFVTAACGNVFCGKVTEKVPSPAAPLFVKHTQSQSLYRAVQLLLPREKDIQRAALIEEKLEELWVSATILRGRSKKRVRQRCRELAKIVKDSSSITPATRKSVLHVISRIAQDNAGLSRRAVIGLSVAGGVIGGYFAVAALYGLSLKCRDNYKNRLHNAVRRGDGGRFDALIDSGVDANAGDSIRMLLPLHEAALTRSNEAESFVRRLVAAGADVNARTLDPWGVEDPSGYTPLYYGVIHDNVRVVTVLLESGAVLGADSHGNSVLHHARSADMVRLLVKHGADVNFVGLGGATPLHNAASRGNIGVIRALVAAGGNVATLDGRGRAPGGLVWERAKYHHHPSANEVRAHRASGIFFAFRGALNTPDEEGYTPLARAVRDEEEISMIQAFIDAGSEVDWALIEQAGYSAEVRDLLARVWDEQNALRLAWISTAILFQDGIVDLRARAAAARAIAIDPVD